MSLSMTNMIFCFSQSSKLINFNSTLAKVEYSSFKQITLSIGFYESRRIAFFGHFIAHLPHSIQRA